MGSPTPPKVKSPLSSAWVGTETVAKFVSSYPEASVEMTLEDRYFDLVESGLEMAIRIGHLADSSLIARRIAPCRMVACASPAYLERKGLPQSPADLARFDLLAYSMSRSPGSWTFTDLYDFTDGASGLYPTGGVIVDSAGNIYGTCPEGGTYNYGTVWELTP